MSDYAKKCKRWFDSGLWEEKQLRLALLLNKLTQAEFDEILGG